jgi:N-acetylmuramoyl-L-alanine amidase CwlD
MSRLHAQAGRFRCAAPSTVRKGPTQRQKIFACCSIFFLSCFPFGSAASRAAYAPGLWFSGTRLILDHAEVRADTVSVGVTDQGLQRFLARMGATLAYQAGQRYVVITTADRRTISFTLGDTRYEVEGTSFTAPFAPYAVRGEPFLPFYTLAKAMHVVPVGVDGETVLQPQIAALDVRNVGKTVIVTVRGATPLRYRKTSASDAGHLALQFSGTASTLEQSRVIGAPALSQITVLVEGTPRAPRTTIAFEGPAGGVRAMYASQSANAFVVAFAPAGTVLAGVPIPEEGAVVASAPEPPAPQAIPSPLASAFPQAVVTAMDENSSAQGMTLHVAVNGTASYEWHRLLDNRWYVDVRNATLGFAAREETPRTDAVLSLRMKQLGDDAAPFVRIALTMPSMRRVEAVPAVDGITIAVAAADDENAPRVGFGRVGADAGVVAVLPTQAPTISAVPTPGVWKFNGRSSARGRVIVLDPGHGGSDAGAQQNGLTEKVITLNVAQSLRSTLAARGWNVKMTRDDDTDVFAPNDSAHDELQARCDIANKAGARLFVSIHVNSFTSGDLNGTTTYYYKDEDLPLADAVHRRLAAALETKDDGVRKANFYVIHHTSMPAILIETAFLSNPGDARLLRSPLFLQKVVTAVADGVGDYMGSASPPVTGMLER